MNYDQTLEWLFEKLPVYQLQGASAYKKDLANILLLAEHLGNPQKQLKCIHVAGTNGKGSTSHLLASALQQAGYKVGLYTSPHLKDFRERIKINGQEIPQQAVVDFVANHKAFFEAHELSFFEMTVGLAFDYFAKEKTDINIIEVGLGGRLDATNIITPLISVITNIGLDHTQFLGNTLAAIAAEKAGIIKSKVPVIIGEYMPETQPVFLAKAREMQAEIYFASELVATVFPSELQGEYQTANKKAVQQTLDVLNSDTPFKVSENHIRNGFMKVVKNTGLQGRWQQMNEYPKVVADTAHNAHGLKIVLAQVQNEKFDELHLVLGVVNDKDLGEILPLFPKNARYYFCRPNIPRGLSAEILQSEAAKYGLKGKVYASVSKAYQNALKNAAPNDFVYVGGSTFVVAEIL